jgi:hypothetical protein
MNPIVEQYEAPDFGTDTQVIEQVTCTCGCAHC